MECKEHQSVAIIGAGPAGCMCAYYASKSAEVTLFEASSPLHTLLYTGGGRCNLAYAEYDFKELAKFYPRGEKFLYSVFSRFGTSETVEFFNEIGVETYTQDDLRIFPVSNSAKDVREKFLKSLKHCKISQERVLSVELYPPLEGRSKSSISGRGININHDSFLPPTRASLTLPLKGGGKNDAKFLVKTKSDTYQFDKVVIAIGGHAGFSLAEKLGHTIIEPKPALTGLISAENFKSLQGVSLKDVEARIFYNDKKFAPLHDLHGDLLFTHEGISGPLAYKISSICARLDYNKKHPLTIRLNLLPRQYPSPEVLRLASSPRTSPSPARGEGAYSPHSFQDMLNSNPKKDIKNLVSEFVPKSLADYILHVCGISLDEKCCNINGQMRDLLLKSLQEFEITVISPAKEGEVVTSGGVSLKEIDAKTMQSKLVNGLYFCGEVIDIDGFCGGFNLQNCWSTGFIAGVNI